VLVLQHPIRLYFIESSGIIDILKRLLKSYRISGQYLKLYRGQHDILMDNLNEITETVFPLPTSSINGDIEQQRLNAYNRMFGLKVKGKEGLVISNDYNKDFIPIFRNVMVNIFKGIRDYRDPSNVRIANPDLLSRYLNNLQDNLNSNIINDVNRDAQEWFIAFESLLALMEYQQFRIALGITSAIQDIGEYAVNIGLKMGESLPNLNIYLELGRLTGWFLTEVQTRGRWNGDMAEVLYSTQESRNDFVRLIELWSIVIPDIELVPALLVNGGRTI
jgi:hypothetical protein